MSRQLLLDEDFIESCKDHPEVELVKCYGCHLMFPEEDLSGGFCANCADPIPEEEDDTEKTNCLDKGSPLARAGRGTNCDRPDIRNVAR
jgi:hypothetical protein